MEIKQFKPIEFKKEGLNIESLNELTKKKWNYASSGKAALYHCLKSLEVQGSILVPVYICSSVLIPIKKSGLTPLFYDIDKETLNPSLIDLEKKITKFKPSCVLVASMYGTPANLDQIEELCTKHQVLLIDDAAQSFGAKSKNGKFVGTFGNAGFFSFSPGKPTSGHSGGFFWTDNSDYSIVRTKNCVYHYLKYLDFYFNRYKIYSFSNFYFFKLLPFVVIFINKYIDTTNDVCCRFETSILGGILDANFKQTFRQVFFTKYIPHLEKTSDFRLITKGNSLANNHKFVILFDNKSLQKHYRQNLLKTGIYTGLGYQLLSDVSETPFAKTVVGKVLEIPIEDSEEKMDYIIHCLNDIIMKNIKQR